MQPIEFDVNDPKAMARYRKLADAVWAGEDIDDVELDDDEIDAKHAGPGDHPSGSPQDVHAGDGGGSGGSDGSDGGRWADWIEDESVNRQNSVWYTFEVNGKKYESLFVRNAGLHDWEEIAGEEGMAYSFQDENGKMSITGRGDAMEVMRKASVALLSKLAEEEPNIVTFSAAEGSRRSLYEFLAKRIAKIRPGYTGATVSKQGGIFAVVRDDMIEVADNFVVEMHHTSGSINTITGEPAKDYQPDEDFWKELEQQLLAVINPDATKHQGPGDHPSGSPQDVHAGDGGGGDDDSSANHRDTIINETMHKIAQGLKGSGLPQETQEFYLKTSQATLEQMPDKAIDRFNNVLVRVNFHPNAASMTRWRNDHVEQQLDDPNAVNGMWDGGTRNLHLDGQPENARDAQGIYAHEFSHVIDWPNHKISESEEWKTAWQEEIVDGPNGLSEYAKTKPSEGFAELGRIIWATGSIAGMDPAELARTQWPKSFAVWEKEGLVKQ